jgi:hypothetical protein
VAAASALDLAPAADEYGPYYGRYISRVPRGDFLALLRSQADEVVSAFSGLTDAQANYAYAPGKWTVTEMLGHMADAERVFQYRALSIGRGDPAPLPGFEQDDWMATAGFGNRALADVLAEWRAVRAATIALAAGLPEEAVLRRGVASGLPVTVRALLHLAPGHTAYHLEVLRDRYRAAAGGSR